MNWISIESYQYLYKSMNRMNVLLKFLKVLYNSNYWQQLTLRRFVCVRNMRNCHSALWQLASLWVVCWHLLSHTAGDREAFLSHGRISRNNFLVNLVDIATIGSDLITFITNYVVKFVQPIICTDITQNNTTHSLILLRRNFIAYNVMSSTFEIWFWFQNFIIPTGYFWFYLWL